jgi:hypothetical protein
MKTRFAFLFIIAATAFAVDTIEENIPFDLFYDHTGLYATRIYTNGVAYRTFEVGEVRQVATSTTNNTYAITLPGFIRNTTFTATVINTDGVESDFSNALAIQFKPRKPGNVRRF